MHLDGAFQTASGLFRLSEGQLPGRDFFSYLGVGLLGLLYPVFLVLGGDLSASVAASHFIALAALFFTTYVVVRMVEPSANRLWAFIFGVLTVATVYFPALEIEILRDRSEPGNSLRPLRALLPYMVVFATMLVLRSGLPVARKVVVAAALAASCFSWSNDFAFPTAAVALLGVFWWLYQQRLLAWPRLFLLGATFLLGVIVVFTLSSFGQPLELITYNFQDVRKEQYWYFGPWFPASRIFSIEDVWEKLLPDYGLWLLVLPAQFVIALRTRRMELMWLALIGLATFLGSAIATVGGHRGDYEFSYDHWAFMAFWASIWAYCRVGLNSANPSSASSYGNGVDRRAWALRLVCAGLVAVLFGKSLVDYRDTRRSLESDPDMYFEPALGGYLGVEWRDYIDMAKTAEGISVQEEYWGLWSAVRREFSPRVDSIIHALGDVKESFFTDADLVITTKASFSAWQQWNLSANYWFYSRLLTDYRVVDFSPTTLLWGRRPESAAKGPLQPCKVSRLKNVFVLSDAVPGVYEVELAVDGSMVPPRGLLLVKNNLNTVVTSLGYLSLDPSRTWHRFPVSVKSEGEQFVVGTLSALGNMGAVGMLLDCRFRSLPEISPDVAPSEVAQYQAYPLTDQYWTRGIANFDTGFFVRNSTGNRELFAPGALVRFSHGEERRVREVSANDDYLNVFLEGPALVPDIHGFPARFTVER